MNNFQRALNHKNSSSIDEKIAHLDEMMVTTGMYSVVKQTDGIEEVPPTFGEAPLGDLNPDNFSWPDQGDGSDPDNLLNLEGLTITDTLGREISTFDYVPGVNYTGWSREPDYSIHPDGKKPLGILFDGRALASTRYFVLYGDGLDFVVQIGAFTTPGPYTDLQKEIANWVENADKSNLTTKTVYIWGGLQVLFGQYYGASQYYPSDRSTTTDPVADRGLYAYTMYIPSTGNSNYATDPGVRTKPPVVSNVISRDNLGDPNYYPGNPLDFLMGLLDLGKQGLDYLMGLIDGDSQLSDEINKAENGEVKNPEEETPNLLNKLIGLITGADDSILDDVVDTIAKTEVLGVALDDLNPAVFEYGSDIANSMVKGEPVYRDKNDLTSRDIDLFMNNSDFSKVEVVTTPVPYADENIREKPDGTVEINPEPSTNNTLRIYDPPTVTIGGEELPAEFGYSNPVAAAGQMQVQLVVPTDDPQDSYLKVVDHAYYNNQSKDPGETPGLTGAIADFVNDRSPGMEDQGYPSNIKGDRIFRAEFEYDELSPDLKDKVHTKTGVKESYSIQTDIKKRFFDPKDIAPEYPKKNPEPMNGGYNSKSTLAPKKLSRDPVIKVTKKDLLRNHRLTKKEVQDMMDTINKINKFLDANPAELIHARIRYPKDDPRLAELNWKLDQQLSASDEYLDKRFPENKRQTARVKKILARNIELTDPRTFKSVKQPVTYEKMFKGEDPNKKVRLKDYSKKSPARFFKKENKTDTSRIKWLGGHVDINIVKELNEEKKDSGMNRYSRVFHHISLDDVKRNRLKAENSRKSFLESVRRAREFLRDLNSPYYSNWRYSSLKEGMTTDSLFFTTFPGTGETNLETIAANDASAYTSTGGQDALNGTSIKASGSGSGSDGGFDLGQSYLAFDGDVTSRHAILDPIDSSKFDTLVIDAIVGNDSNGGEDPDAAGEELRLYYLEPGGDSFKSISVNTAGEQVLSANADVLIDLGAGSGALQQFSINLPSHARGEGFTYMLFQLTNSGAEFDHYGITNIKYQRRNPISLFVSLDSPEAVSFINDGSGGMTSEEKKKQLEDMLAASDEYMETMFPTNQEAMKRAEENLQRNIDISLDPNTFKFPEYGTPEYNQMFNPYMDADSDIEEIKNSLESKGLSLDNLDKDFNSQKGTFTSLGQEGTLILLNNPDTQEQTLTAMGIDLSLLTNYTADSWDKIGKITNLKPGGTPATGWDGKFYESDDPLLELSQIIPLETYLQVKGTDNYIGVERPDMAEPGYRYVMEKEYDFSEATPTYTGVRNKDIEERNDRTYYTALGGAEYVGSHGWDYNLYTGSDEYLSGSDYMLRELVGSATQSLNYINKNAEFLAYDFLSKYQSGENGSYYGDLYNQYKDTDIFNNYDPLWVWNSDPKMSEMLSTLRGISSGRDLDSPLDYYTSNSQSAESKASEERYHQSYNDRLYDDLQKALKLLDTPRTLSQYEKDEWYYERDDARVTEVTTTHPYASPQQPQTPAPDNSYINIQVGDEQIIIQGGKTIVDTLVGIDNRQANAVESELDKIKDMPPDVRNELERLLSIAGTTEYTPTPPKTKKEIEDYWASLPPEKISEIEGRTQATGVDAVGLGLAVLAGLALGATGATATLTSAVSSGLSKIKNLTKAKPTPTKASYPTSSPKPVTQKGADFGARMRQQVAQEYGTTVSQQGGKVIRTNPKPQSGYNPGGNTSLRNSYEPKGKSLIDNYEPKAKHNEKITKHPKMKSPKEFFKRANIKSVYPDTPPPEMVNGRHPDWRDDTKLAKRFVKLDPESARAMPDTGSPQVDAVIRAARKKPK